MSALDRERIEVLAAEIMRPILANYRVGPPSPDRVHEALNALAFAAAQLLAATEFNAEARRFFDIALEQQLLHAGARVN